MSNVITFPPNRYNQGESVRDDQQDEEDKFRSQRILNFICDQIGDDVFELKDQYDYTFGLIQNGHFFVRLEQTELGIDHE